MLHLLNSLKPALAWFLLLSAVSGLHAQEGPAVKWRTDYNAARKESEVRGVPVFIEFVRPACFPCERMEQTTFRDARIVAALNDKFIPLRINGLEEAGLASRLQISLYPTMVLAGADGRINQTLVGYQDADALNETLQRLLATLTPTESMLRDYQNAMKWESTGDYPRALTALRSILDDGKGAALQKNAQDLLAKIEKIAVDRLAIAKNLHDKGQSTEALDTLTDLMRVFPGTPATKEAADQLTRIARANEGAKVAHRTKRVRELLTQAQDFYKSKDYIPCLDRCEIILAQYGDLPEGQQAFALASEIKNNPEWLQGAADVMTDRLGGVYLALADSYLKRGDTQKSQFYLQRVIQAFPGSRMAESAQLRLTQMRPPMPANKGLDSARP